MQCRMIPPIAFVPLADVVGAIETFADYLPAEHDPFDYFEDTYIGRPNRRGARRNPFFPMVF